MLCVCVRGCSCRGKDEGREEEERATGLGTEQEEARVEPVEPVSGGSCVRELTMRQQKRREREPKVEETLSVLPIPLAGRWRVFGQISIRN